MFMIPIFKIYLYLFVLMCSFSSAGIGKRLNIFYLDGAIIQGICLPCREGCTDI
uniref:Uncharacterized protein n=1 Tax=Anguilla anguilla TaxID=7936 RepID=A0A0E9SIP3_ANGAN